MTNEPLNLYRPQYNLNKRVDGDVPLIPAHVTKGGEISENTTQLNEESHPTVQTI